ncbi:MAG: DUF448 domain-containing protein [Evtepia sp.]
MVLDATGKKSGRGAYVCRDPQCLKKARKSGRWTGCWRSASSTRLRGAGAPDGNGSMTEHILSMIGLAKKAGQVAIGEEPVGAAARAKDARVILVAQDAAAGFCAPGHVLRPDRGVPVADGAFRTRTGREVPWAAPAAP